MREKQLTTPAAYLVHQSRGRLRLKIPDRRLDEDYFQHLAKQLSNLASITNTKSNPASGSIILYTHPDFDMGELDRFTESDKLFHFFRYGHRSIASKITNDLSQIDVNIQQLSRGRFDIKSAYIAALISLAAVQISKGKTLGPASGFIWEALKLIQEKNS